MSGRRKAAAWAQLPARDDQPPGTLLVELVDDFPGPQYPLRQVRFLLEHLEWMRRCGRSERTLFARRETLVMLADALGSDPTDATFAQLDAWQRSLTTPRLRTWRTALITPYFRYLHDRGYRQDNPAALLPKPRHRRGLPRPIAEDELAAAVAAAPARIEPWLLLAGWSGLRAIEIAGLMRESFTVDAGRQAWVRVIGKGQVVRDVPVPGWCWERIAPALPASGPCWRQLRSGEPMTPRLVSDFANRYLRSRGLPDTLHALRHRFATEVLRTSGDVRLVQDALGHADLSTLAVYTRVRPSSVAAAVEALPRPAQLPLGTLSVGAEHGR